MPIYGAVFIYCRVFSWMSAASPPPPEIWDLFAISAAQIKTGGGVYYSGPGSPGSAGARGGDPRGEPAVSLTAGRFCSFKALPVQMVM